MLANKITKTLFTKTFRKYGALLGINVNWEKTWESNKDKSKCLKSIKKYPWYRAVSIDIFTRFK